MSLKKLGKAWMYFCTAILTLLILAAAGYALLLWLGTDRNNDFLAIDSCLDSGGRWDDDAKTCIHAS